MHVDEAGPHHESGDVDDVRLRVALPVARERRPDGDDLPAVDDDVSHPFGPGSRVHDQTTAENQHSSIQLHNCARSHWMIGQADRRDSTGRSDELWAGSHPYGCPHVGEDRTDRAARWLEDTFADLVAEHGVPGATVAVPRGRAVVTAAGGVTSLRTKVEVDADTVFQIGSITKLWTTTLVMQLVDEGLLDLDQPRSAPTSPSSGIGDEAAATAITTRHLLTHTAGFEGDIFTDTGRGDDALEKYVDVAGGAAAALRSGRARSPTTTPASSCSAASSRCSAGSRTTQVLRRADRRSRSV